MKRRVLVAQALVHKPPIIVLDEPTAGVDVELRQTLWHFIARLNKEGHTVLLTTHYLEEAEALCGRIAMLKNGQVVALNSTSELLKAANGQRAAVQDRRGLLPAALASIARVTGASCSCLRRTRRKLKTTTCARRRRDVQDMEIRRADLEDVFLQVMSGIGVQHSAGGGAMTGWQPCSGAKRCCASGRSASRPWPRPCSPPCCTC